MRALVVAGVVPAAEIIKMLQQSLVDVEKEKSFYSPDDPHQAVLRGGQYYIDKLIFAIEALVRYMEEHLGEEVG